MGVRDGDWTSLSKTLLIAAASHSWVLLVVLPSISITAYIAAYFLVSAIQRGQKPGGLKIKTPFLSISSEPSGRTDNHIEKRKTRA
jgi:hypothetical protein